MNIIQEEFRKARKEHVCSWCNETIPIATRYQDTFIKNDGEVYHWKSCTRCAFIVSKLSDYIYDSWDNTADAQDFADGVSDFCHDHVCGECSHYKSTYYGCECELDYNGMDCLDSVGEVLLDNIIVHERRFKDKPGDELTNPVISKLIPREHKLTKYPDGT